MIEIDNRQNKFDADDSLFVLIEKAIKYSLKHEGFEKAVEVSVVLTDNEGICEINKQYRNIDSPTDVLSFPMLDFEEGYAIEGDVETDIEDINPENGDVVLGDIVISLERAFEQSIEFGHSFHREIAFLTVHSVLHLLGYDHIKDEDRIIMREKEETILSGLELTRD
jgi:probable rRNA maturation factor